MTGIKSYLLSRGLTFTDEWLEACTEWVKESFSVDGPITEDELRGHVYEQWLDVDLQELESQCLPKGLNKERFKVLTGQYGLQVNSFRDIGESAYNQYNKIKKLENENTAVSASNNDEFKFSWQPKARRCLYLTLTDGSQEILGMELVPIPAIHLDMKPGTKVVISGPIYCRRGILHLKPGHIKILGGEVESLVSTNSVENVLSRALHDPKKSEHAESGAASVISSQNMKSSQRNVHDRTTQEISTQGISQASTQPISRTPITNSATTSLAAHDEFDDDDIFMEIDEEALLRSVSGQSAAASTGNGAVERANLTKPKIIAKVKKYVPPPDPEPQIEPATAPAPSKNRARKPSGSSSGSDSGGKQKKISSYLKPVPSKIGPASRQPTLPTTDEDIDIVDLELEDDGVIISDSVMASESASKTKSNKAKSGVSALPEKPTPITKSPFQYIRQINKGLFKTGETIVVRGIIATLTSNIAVDKSNGEWKLSVNVNDGSGYLIAEIAPQVLQSIIGFAPAQMKLMKSSKSGDGKQKVMEGMKNLTSMLVHFNGIIWIKITGQPEQLIVQLTDISSQNVCALVCRTSLDEL